MAKLTIDNEDYEVEDGNNLLHACLSLGLNLPYFCWHPCMGSVGACRQCAVKQYQDENDERGRIVMACMTPASEGVRISIDDSDAKDFRGGVIELLMTNHPHDCPVCEEGGECHLQDMTEMSGHTIRDYDQTKRTHRNQYLGPFINHEMNRCISCYRCVRFYQDYAGGHDLDAMGAHNHVYFGRHEDGVLESPFSGNLAEVCPTGVFTDKTFSQHYSRKWDLQTSPSVCQHCAVGCNVTPGERYGTLKRITNRYHSEVNSYFLCDRGRFGYGFVNSDSRLTQAIQRKTITDNDEAQSATTIALSLEESLASLAQCLKSPNTIAIGSPRASLEANFALQRAVGIERFYSGVGSKENTLNHLFLKVNQSRAVNVASLNDMEACDCVLIVGEDITHTAPRMALSLRQTVRQEARKLADEARIPFWQDAAVRELAQQAKSPLYILHPCSTDLDDISAAVSHGKPAELTILINAITLLLQGGSLSEQGHSTLSETQKALIKTVAGDLRAAKRPLLITGTSLQDEALALAMATLIETLHKARESAIDCHFILAENNSLGLSLLNAEKPEHDLHSALDCIESGKAKNLVILENDLYQRIDNKRLEQALDRLEELVVIDHTWHQTAAKADLILPAATFAESEGTLVSSEGRAQRFFATFPIDSEKNQTLPAWQWLTRAQNGGGEHFDQLSQACAQSQNLLAPLNEVAPDADFRSVGLKVPRMPHRYSGRTAMYADRNVSERKQASDPESALAFTMEGTQIGAPNALTNNAWAPGWNSNQSVHKFQDDVGGPLNGGPNGIRLFDESQLETNSGPSAIEDKNAADQFEPIPLYHIFGSDELSRSAAPVAERSPDAYVGINATEATRLDVIQGDGLIVEGAQSGERFSLRVTIKEELPAACLALPMGLGGLHRDLLTQGLLAKKDPEWQRLAASDDANVIVTDKTGAAS